ncbi:MAG: hypothetical protein GXO76_05235 [Calditrichaeota bacterium]|nr:hypothetical protein [Calditrichota bacterium]
MKINEINSQKYISNINQHAAKKEPVVKKQAPNGKDEIQLSLKGKQLSQSKHLLGIAKEKLKNIPDVRFDKIEEAVKNIQEGKYNQPEVVEKVAHAIIQQADFQEIIGQKAQSQTLSPERIQDIQTKMSSGFYSKPEVVDKIAQKILRDFE